MRLWRQTLACFVLIPVGIVLAFAMGGCSFNSQLGSLFERSRDDNRGDITGSVMFKPAQASLVTESPSDADLAHARVAVIAALTQGDKSASIPWENPSTGARGTVTPIAAAYTVDGLVCHDFLASYVRDRKEAWLQGEACRVHKGGWEVRSMKPWQRARE